MKERLYSIHVLDVFGVTIAQCPSSGYCAQHALENAIEAGSFSLPFAGISTALIKCEESRIGPVFKIEFGAD